LVGTGTAIGGGRRFGMGVKPHGVWGWESPSGVQGWSPSRESGGQSPLEAKEVSK